MEVRAGRGAARVVEPLRFCMVEIVGRREGWVSGGSANLCWVRAEQGSAVQRLCSGWRGEVGAKWCVARLVQGRVEHS